MVSLRFLILAGLGACILWLSLYDGVRYYRTSVEQHRSAVAASAARLQQIIDADDRFIPDSQNWGEFWGRGYDIHKPPNELALFIRGLSPFLGRTSKVSFEPEQRLIRSSAAEFPETGFFPQMDLGRTVQVVIGLFVLLMTGDILCGEKEAGTLRLVSTFPVSRPLFLFEKLVGALIPVLLSVLLPLILGIGVILLLPDISFPRPVLYRLALILLSIACYVTAMASAGLFASSITQPCVHRPRNPSHLLGRHNDCGPPRESSGRRPGC